MDDETIKLHCPVCGKGPGEISFGKQVDCFDCHTEMWVEKTQATSRFGEKTLIVTKNFTIVMEPECDKKDGGQ